MSPSRNDLCPCGSGRRMKHCHGRAAAAPATPRGARTPPPKVSPEAAPPGSGAPVENPFRKIFRADGTVDQEYVASRLDHFRTLLDTPRFVPIRFDRETLEGLLEEHLNLFQPGADFEAGFAAFAAAALPVLVTKEFDEKAKEALHAAVKDPELTPRDRAAAACALVFTLPEDPAAAVEHHRNPFFDLILKTTYNETLARVEFLASLDKEELSPMERDARVQEFLRRTPAIAYEASMAFQAAMRRAVASYERGEYSFGYSLDMILHGVRTFRQRMQEFHEEEGEAFTETQQEEFSRRVSQSIQEAFAADVGDDEEAEIFARMDSFLDAAVAREDKKTAKGLSSALEVMAGSSEIRQRLLLAAYHEAIAGRRLFQIDESERESAAHLIREPFDADSYLEYGEFLETADEPVRAERVYRNAMEFFPENAEVRERLAAVAERLIPIREEEFRAASEARTEAWGEEE